MANRPHRRNKLIVAGGGSGGHIWPGVAIADAWRSHFGKEVKVLFVGAEGGLEEKLVPQAGYPLDTLKMGSLKGQSFSRVIRTLFLIPFNMIQATVILLREKPQAVIGVGGYASGPLVLAASTLGKLMRIRSSIIEPNAAAGLTNRILRHFVSLVFSTFKPLRPHRRWHVTGYPVRNQIQTLRPSDPGQMNLFVFGGSQGAVGMNTLVLDALKSLGDFSSQLSIVHQAGKRDFVRVRDLYHQLGLRVQVSEFIDDMVSEYEKASLIICRAGASTLAELAAVGRAAILVPLPTAADNHQEMNARVMEREGAVLIAKQNVTKPDVLAAQIRGLLTHRDRIAAMENAIRQFNRPQAAQDVVMLLSGEKTSSRLHSEL